MSEEDVEIVRRNTDAFSRGDFDGFMEDWAPDAVVDWSNSAAPMQASIGGTTRSGRSRSGSARRSR